MKPSPRLIPLHSDSGTDLSPDEQAAVTGALDGQARSASVVAASTGQEVGPELAARLEAAAPAGVEVIVEFQLQVENALDLVRSDRLQQAFRLDQEPPAVRDTYGDSHRTACCRAGSCSAP